MDTTTLIIIATAVVVLALVAWGLFAWQRRRRLKREFGPEYQRLSHAASSKREAHSELEERRQRHEQLDIRALSDEERRRHRDEWQAAQARFVDAPKSALQKAETIIQDVMRDRGYPVEDFEQRVGDLSVDHPDVVQHYRKGHRIATRESGDGSITTEDLRKAMLHYRELFDVLVDERDRERQPA